MVDANSTSTETLTIHNPGNATLNVTDITLPSGFSVTTSTYVIAAEAQEDVLITFSPTDAHLYFGSAIIHSDATGGDSTLIVKGKGTTRIISLSGTMAFGNVDVNSTSDATLTITNSGDSELSITDISLPTGFTASVSTLAVASGESEDITITFAPTQAIGYTGDITITSNATSGTNTIPVSGTGTSTTGIEYIQTNELSVYPNPASQVIYLKGFKDSKTVQVYNLIGELVIEQSLENDVQEINISRLRSGMYFIKATDIKESIRFIKK